MLLFENTVLRNKYQVIRLISHGGMGAIYQATDIHSGGIVALKQNMQTEQPLRKAFEREAGLLSRLAHPSLPRYFDYFEETSGQFLAFEFIEGPDLAERLARQRAPFPVEQVLDWADQLLAVLEYLHEQHLPIIHRDIKPHNLKLDSKGKLILLDFGLAKGKLASTSVKSVQGYTLAYASPEQILGEGTDARSDLYSVAATMYDLLTLRKPPDAVQRMSEVYGNNKDPLQPIQQINPDVPATVFHIVSKAMELKPGDRFNSARSMRASLKISLDQTDVNLLPQEITLSPNNLPAPLSAVLGREADENKVEEILLSPSVRMLTLTGIGGVGKTTLALQVARRMLGYFRGGVWWVPLDSIFQPGFVLPSLAAILGVKDSGEKGLLEMISSRLSGQNTLLVIDNFEQVLDAAPRIAELLAACQDLKILATSRERLHISPENEYPLQPLYLPDLKRNVNFDEFVQSPAVALFAERSRAVRPDFQLDENNIRAVAEICVLLDGLPLAIELAAARIRLFSPQAMLANLDQRFKLLRGGARDLPPRQRNLLTSIEWSYDLLSPEEKLLFRRLAVFVENRSLEAIEAVCNPSDDPRVPALDTELFDLLGSLIDKSLLQRKEAIEHEPSFSMLVTIHQYASQQLRASEEYDPICERHAAYYAYFAELAEPELRGAHQKEWMARLESNHENLRAALDWSLRTGDTDTLLRISGSLWRFWWTRGYLSEAAAWLEKALARPGGSPEARLKAMTGAGIIARDLGDLDRARSLFEQSLELWQPSEDQSGVASALNNLGSIYLYQEDYDQAAAFFQRSLLLRREQQDRQGIAGCLNNLGLVMLHKAEYKQAEDCYKESLEIYQEMQDQWGTALALNNLAFVRFKQGQYDSARRLFQESLRLSNTLGDREEISTVLEGLSWIAGAQGQPELAARLSGKAKLLLEELGTNFFGLDIVEHEHLLALLQETLGETALQAIFEQSRSEPLEQVIQLALSAQEGSELSR